MNPETVRMGRLSVVKGGDIMEQYDIIAGLNKDVKTLEDKIYWLKVEIRGLEGAYRGQGELNRKHLSFIIPKIREALASANTIKSFFVERRKDVKSVEEAREMERYLCECEAIVGRLSIALDPDIDDILNEQ